MSNPITDRLDAIQKLLDDHAAHLHALNTEFATRRQPVLDRQAALLAEQAALQGAQTAVATVDAMQAAPAGKLVA